MSTGCSFTTTAFVDEEKDREEKAYSEVPSIPKVALVSEFHVLKILLVFLTLSAKHLVALPLWIAKSVQQGSLFSTPESRHSFGVFLSFVFAAVAILASHITLNFSFNLMATQKYYKLWAGYTLSKVIVRFSVRMHGMTHRMLRGAVRTNSFIPLVLTALVRSVAIFIYYAIYTIVNACFLAGISGKEGLFFSAVLHIQAVIAKKYFPKPTEGPPNIDEPINRAVMILVVLYHIAGRPFAEIPLLVKFEFGWAILRFFMTALTDDGPKLYEVMSQGSNNAVWSFQNQPPRFENSLIITYPFEVFALLFANLLFIGSNLYRICIAGGIIGAAFAGPIVIQLLPAVAPDEKKKKKDDVDGEKKKPKGEKEKEKKDESEEEKEKEKPKSD